MGVPFDLDLSDFGELGIQLRESVNIERSDPLDQTGPKEVISVGETMIIRPVLRPQIILPSGAVVQEPDFRAYLFTPNPAIQEGDIVVRDPDVAEEDRPPKLFVDGISHQRGTNIMVLGLVQTRK